MIIKTITCHDVYNAGAGLQAYALYAYLSKLGHEVEIIDYKPDYLSRHYSFKVVGNPVYEKNILIKLAYLAAKFPGRLVALLGRRKRNYDIFKKEYLKVTDMRYTSNEQLKQELPEADIYFAGSDQIWNPVFKNGKDPAFYLDFVPDNKIKASYAASFSVDKLQQMDKEIIKKRVEKLDFISVREKSGVQILDDLGIHRAEVVMDPVFLLDKNVWEALCEEKQEKYVLVYDFDNNNEVEKIAKRIAENKNCKIYSVLKCEYADKSFEKEGPIGFVSLIKNADYIVSNSFHATAFSIIFEKEFLVLKRKEAINSRLVDLLEICGVTDRLVDNINKVSDDLSLIDYSKVNKLLCEKINESKEFINKVLAEEDKHDR